MAGIDLKLIARECFDNFSAVVQLLEVVVVSERSYWAKLSFVKSEHLADNIFWEQGVLHVQFDWDPANAELTISRLSLRTFPWIMRDHIAELAIQRNKSGLARHIGLGADVGSDQLRISARAQGIYPNYEASQIVATLREYMPTFLFESSTSFVIICAQAHGCSIDRLEPEVPTRRT